MTCWILNEECVAGMRAMPDNCIAAVVTDPPYGLSKEPNVAEVLRHWLAGDDYQHTGGGFMGKAWDSFVPGPSVWREVLRVLKPGGHVLSFSGTRTYDLSVLAMRIAGFEIRDQLAWIYGTGFPKSLDVAKAIGQLQHAEPVITPHPTNACPGGPWCECTARDERSQSGATKHPPHYVWPAGSDAEQWSGWGTALKPAQEPIVLARKPLVGTVAANVLAHGTGGINVDACRIEGAKPDTTRGAGGQHGVTSPRGAQGRILDDGRGRWPANVLFDSEDIYPPEAFDKDGNRFFYVTKPSPSEREAGLDHLPLVAAEVDTGREPDSAGGQHGRAGRHGERRNHHPTVKPIELMRYLIRLITPPGGIVLDPFAGSGTTGVAAALEGFDFLGFEMMADYAEIARARIRHHGGTIGEV